MHPDALQLRATLCDKNWAPSGAFFYWGRRRDSAPSNKTPPGVSKRLTPLGWEAWGGAEGSGVDNL